MHLLKHVSTGLLRELEEDTSLNKLLSMLCLSSQINTSSLIGNIVFKQDIGIPTSINQAPFWANLFLYFFESKYIN